jgi:hypothetical protein
VAWLEFAADTLAGRGNTCSYGGRPRWRTSGKASSPRRGLDLNPCPVVARERLLSYRSMAAIERFRCPRRVDYGRPMPGTERCLNAAKQPFTIRCRPCVVQPSLKSARYWSQTGHKPPVRLATLRRGAYRFLPCCPGPFGSARLCGVLGRDYSSHPPQVADHVHWWRLGWRILLARCVAVCAVATQSKG